MSLKINSGVLYALLAAFLFGISTPFAKLLLESMPPLLLAGLLYLGSGFGLFIIRLYRDRGWRHSELTRQEWPWLIGAIFFGGILAPVLLLYGLSHTSGSAASLLLNVEAVLTACIAWIVFKENADTRIVVGMVAIVIGGVLVSWPTDSLSLSNREWLGPVAIFAACACWAIDNNLTRKISASDALFIAGSKGFSAGLVNFSLAMSIGYTLPPLINLLEGAVLGFIGYGDRKSVV